MGGVALKKGKLTHVDARGRARMVDVSGKPVQRREAVAQGEIHLQPATVDLIEAQGIAKGDVFAAARLAGIMAAKKTGELIPLCHPLALKRVRGKLRGGREPRQDPNHRQGNDCSTNGGGDGSIDGGECGRSHDLRHVQGGG